MAGIGSVTCVDESRGDVFHGGGIPDLRGIRGCGAAQELQRADFGGGIQSPALLTTRCCRATHLWISPRIPIPT